MTPWWKTDEFWRGVCAGFLAVVILSWVLTLTRTPDVICCDERHTEGLL